MSHKYAEYVMREATAEIRRLRAALATLAETAAYGSTPAGEKETTDGEKI